MLNPIELKKSLNYFAKKVLLHSRRNLGNKGKLASSLTFKRNKTVKVMKNSIKVTFDMLVHGLFYDKGVKGKDPSRVSPNAKITGQQAPKSPYKFGTGSSRGTFEKFSEKMAAFAKKRSIRFRQGKTGKYAKGGYEGMGYVIAKNIYFRGLKPSLFFTKPFNKHFKELPEYLKTAYALDVEKFMEFTLKDNKKKI